MGFKSVYRCLQEVFPQIDARILKAVAIENSKDADAAVNDILTEVLPLMASTSKNGTNTDIAVEVDNDVPSLERRSTVAGRLEDSARRNSSFAAANTDLYKIDEAGPSSGPKFTAVENSENGNCRDSGLHAHLTHLGEVANAGSSLEQSPDCKVFVKNGSVCGSFHDDTGVTRWNEAVNESEVSGSYVVSDGDNHLVRSIMNEELPVFPENICAMENELEFGQNASSPSTALEKKGTVDRDHTDVELKASGSGDKINGIVGDEQGSFATSPSSINGKDCFSGSLENPDHESKVLDCSKANDFDLLSQERNFIVDECCDGAFVAELVLPAVHGQVVDAIQCNFPSDIHGSPPAADGEELPATGSQNLASEKVNSVGETGSVDDDFTKHSFTQSGQICSTDFLDEIIEDAKNNKKTLFSALESIMNMMKEVELQEKAAEQAKVEAAMGGMDILVKVEELKQMLAHAKDANDMHAGEVFGEKAILATEVRELQSRLLCLSDERDKSLATLDEMRQTLDERLAAAEEMKKAAEQEKLKKEESARKALAEQEAIMEKVVQESKLLEQEAQQNSKLREFLVDRGSIMDILQGEISVICQDVSMLKEKFDNRVPLSMSVSSSQTTCKLASSGSSLKSVSSVVAPEERESPKSPEKDRLDSSIGDLAPKSSNKEDWMKSDDKELLGDGWDMFEIDAELDI